jgi:hypothetical protein
MKEGFAYYDLARNPPTWNAFDFLLQAEMWRRREGLDRLRVRVLPGPAEGFRRDSLPPFGGEERRRWLRSIVLPLPELLPSCGARAEEIPRDAIVETPAFGRDLYAVGFATNVAAARAGCAPFRADPDLVAQCRNAYGDYVTITLRETGWWASRQSDVREWMRIGWALKMRGFAVVFVRDAAKAEEPLPGEPCDTRPFVTAPVASIHSWARAALYAGARMNLGISNGPLWFAWFMGAPVAIFDLIHDDEPCASAAHFRACGLAPGEQLANAKPGQRLFWHKATAEAVLDGFDRLIDTQRAGLPYDVSESERLEMARHG